MHSTPSNLSGKFMLLLAWELHTRAELKQDFTNYFSHLRLWGTVSNNTQDRWCFKCSWLFCTGKSVLNKQRHEFVAQQPHHTHASHRNTRQTEDWSSLIHFEGRVNLCRTKALSEHANCVLGPTSELAELEFWTGTVWFITHSLRH